MPTISTRGAMSARGFGMFASTLGPGGGTFSIFNRGLNTAQQSAKYFLAADNTQDYNYLTSVQRGGIAMSNATQMISSWGFLANNQGVTGFTLLTFASDAVANGDLLAPSRNGMAASNATTGLYNANGAVATASAVTYKYAWANGAQAQGTNLTANANFGTMCSGATQVIAAIGAAGRVTSLYTWANDSVIAGPLFPVATATPTFCSAGNVDTVIFGGSSTQANNNKYTWANNTLVAHTIALVNGNSTAVTAAGNATFGLFHGTAASASVQNRKLNYTADTSINGASFSFASNSPTSATNGIPGITMPAA